MRHSLKPQALADLAHIYAEGAAQFGVDQAERYAAELEKAFASLSAWPRAARLRSELIPPVRAFPFRSHVVIYDLGPDDRVIVLRVRHGRENWVSDPV